LGYGEMGRWEIELSLKFILTRKFKIFINEKLPLKTNIPIFHYSMCEAKGIYLINNFNFSVLYKF